MNSLTINNTTIYTQQIPENISELISSASEMDLRSINNINSIQRQKEKLITAKFIRLIFGDKIILNHNDFGVPFLEGLNINISISHCRDQIIIATNPTNNIGIDIELQRQQLNRIKDRFLSDKEITHYNTPSLLLKAWTIKEAVYKAALTPGLSLSKQIELPFYNTIAIANTPNGIKKFEIHTILSTDERCISLATEINH